MKASFLSFSLGLAALAAIGLFYQRNSCAAASQGTRGSRSKSDAAAAAELQAQLATAKSAITDLKRQLNVLHCETKGVTSTGGFCLTDKTGASLGGNDVLPPLLAKRLFQLFDGASVIDLGAGVGHYEKFWAEMQASGTAGGPTSTRAYDGSENIADMTGGRVKFADLTERQELGVEDWVMSIEVAEHIPHDLESVFLDNLHRHNRKGLVISWAKPKQPGHAHINGQDAAYVEEVFRDMGYEYQQELTKELRQLNGDAWWLRETLFVFFRRKA